MQEKKASILIVSLIVLGVLVLLGAGVVIFKSASKEKNTGIIVTNNSSGVFSGGNNLNENSKNKVDNSGSGNVGSGGSSGNEEDDIGGKIFPWCNEQKAKLLKKVAGYEKTELKKVELFEGRKACHIYAEYHSGETLIQDDWYYFDETSKETTKITTYTPPLNLGFRTVTKARTDCNQEDCTDKYLE